MSWGIIPAAMTKMAPTHTPMAAIIVRTRERTHIQANSTRQAAMQSLDPVNQVTGATRRATMKYVHFSQPFSSCHPTMRATMPAVMK
jgi:hypothetical protein